MRKREKSREIVDLHRSLKNIIILRPLHVSSRGSCHGNGHCSTSYTSSVTMLSCEKRRSSREKVPDPIIFSHKNTERSINHDCYTSTQTPLCQPITLIQHSIREGADLCVGDSCEQPAPSLLLPMSPSQPFRRYMLNVPLCFSLVILRFHCLSKAAISWRQTNLCLLYISCESPGKPCLYSLRQGHSGRQPGESLSSSSLFFFFFVLPQKFQLGSCEM